MIDEAKLADWRGQYGRIKHVTYNGVDVVFRKPKPVECERYEIAREAKNPNADYEFAQVLVVHCGGQEGPAAFPAFLALKNDYPLCMRNPDIALALAKLSGVVQDDEKKGPGNVSTLSGGSQTISQEG